MSASYEAKDRRDSWRSYFLADEVALDGMSIANATGAYDPNTNRPIVTVEFDRAGAQAFGDVTARVVGHKLAIVVDGTVRSAPVINSAIRGGRASITMGTSDAQKMASRLACTGSACSTSTASSARDRSSQACDSSV